MAWPQRVRWVGLLCQCALAVDLSDIWYFVDINAVICPKVDANQPEYTLGIEKTGNIVDDSPYIFGFLRKSNEAMTITFTVKDANGDEVIPQSTYNLAALSNAVPDTCKCTTTTLPPSVATKYGQNYGSSPCQAWDNQSCDTWYGLPNVGSWCCSSWCYSTKDCPDSYQSEVVPGAYWSYAACRVPPPATCKWTDVALAADPCSCRNVGALLAMNATSLAQYKTPSGDPKTYGQSCFEWDEMTCMITYVPPPDDKSGCCRAWCYVDPTCPTAVPSTDNSQLAWSYTPCMDNATKVKQCPDPVATTFAALSPKATLDLCKCTGEMMPADLLPEDAPLEYGKVCKAHDKDACDTIHEGSDTDIWCCKSWCWVNKTCPVARESDVWPGHYFSASYCQATRQYNVYDLQNCKYNPTACQCKGQLPLEALPKDVSPNYGSKCDQWDRAGCAARFKQGWNASADNSWCCDNWCYISELCPLAQPSSLNPRLYWSSDLCTPSNQLYTAGTDQCGYVATRRLEEDAAAPETRLGEKVNHMVEEAWTALSRRLSSRRRAAPAPPPPSSPRRRAPPPPPPPPSDPRRRASSQPSTPPRRRVSPPRRRSSDSPSSTDPRRRAPSPDLMPRRRAPAPLPQDPRRRASAVSGTAYDTSRRRSSVPDSGTLRRRRSSQPVSYGYGSRPELVNQYGGVAPQTTPYGYAGYNAVKPQQKTNIAMYAGTALAGAAIGAGGMWAYQSMSSSTSGWGASYRRRRANPAEFCVIPPSGGSRAGDFMECYQCNQRYYNCLPTANCLDPSGCSYVTARSYNRDDLGDTGFIPSDWTWPLTVTFQAITAKDIFPDEFSGGCPPTSAANANVTERYNKSMYIGADLFMIITKQDAFAANGKASAGQKVASGTLAWIVEICAALVVLGFSR